MVYVNDIMTGHIEKPIDRTPCGSVNVQWSQRGRAIVVRRWQNAENVNKNDDRDTPRLS